MSDIKAAVFDFDYTLADSSRGAVECINFALKEMGIGERSSETICRTIGLSLRDTLITLAGPHDDRRCNEFARLFVQRADQVMSDLTMVYDSVAPTLAALRECGLQLGIVSTKFRYRIAEILARDKLMQFFDVVIGGEDVEQHKPHPEGLLKAIEQLQCPPRSIVYVGDSVADAEVAKRAAVPFIAVLSGVTPREHFSDYATHAVLESLSELSRLVS